MLYFIFVDNVFCDLIKFFYDIDMKVLIDVKIIKELVK